MTDNNINIQCIIVDDEPPAQRVLEKYISNIPFLQLAGKCRNAFEASLLLHQHSIDLVFLDINMPQLSGLDFLRTLKNTPAVIITTAYSEYALEGFELNVTDYLQKPFSFERFFRAVNKVSDNLQDKQPSQELPHINYQTENERDFIFIKEDKVQYRIDLKEIKYLESVGDYIKIHTPSKIFLIYDSLKNFDNTLSPEMFIRVHKSFIVPFAKIDSIEGNMIKINNQTIPVGVTFRKDFFDAIRKLGI